LASKDLKIEANISPFALGNVGGSKSVHPEKSHGSIELVGHMLPVLKMYKGYG
jgi:hypothetical protein